MPKQEPDDDSPPVIVQRRLGCGGFLLGLVLILTLLAGFIFYRLETFPDRVREAFAAMTGGSQPRITVDEHVIYEQTKPVLELSVVSREMVVERETTSTWLGSTKRLRVRGVYRVKAGFDLSQSFSVNIDGALAQSVRVRLPPPRLLSVELQNLEVLTMDNGLWNHVHPEEFASEVNALNTDARLKANQEGIMAEAKKTFIAQVEERLGPGHRVELQTNAASEPKK